MKTTKIQFNGRSYYSRIVESVDGEELLIGSTILLDALQSGSFNDENEGFASKEAERIYGRDFLLYRRENASASRKRVDSRTQKG